jgi:hypothetical protein
LYLEDKLNRYSPIMAGRSGECRLASEAVPRVSLKEGLARVPPVSEVRESLKVFLCNCLVTATPPTLPRGE